MPRIAMATSTIERVRPVADSDDEASMTRVDDLIQRGRSQGHLSLAELRNAFDQAGLTPAEGRSILRELSEAGVRLADELAEDSRAAKSRPARAASAAQRLTRSADDAGSDDESDLDLGDADVVTPRGRGSRAGRSRQAHRGRPRRPDARDGRLGAHLP